MIIDLPGHSLRLHPDCYVAANASLIGNVSIEENVSIWYGAVLRGDRGAIRIGSGSNIQDNAVVHEGTTIGKNVMVGHSAVLHGCTVEDNCLIGIGAIVLNGCVIGENSIVAAGSLVPQNTVIPPGSMVMGAPAKVRRPLAPEEIADTVRKSAEYVARAALQLPKAE